MSSLRIAPAGPADRAAWTAMRSRLWPDDGAEAHDAVVAEMLAQPHAGRLALVARAHDGTAAGFAEAVIRRDYVNGCDGSPVLFLEGIYVAPDHRRGGVGRALAEAVAAWGRGQGLVEFASDALLEDPAAHAFHRAIGFAETERVVFFRRAIP